MVKGIFLLCFLSAFNACKKTAPQGADFAELERNDSIFVWIAEGRNSANPLEERKALLQKAYRGAVLSANDSLKAKYFSRLSLAYLRIDDSLLFRNTNREAMKMAQKVSDTTTHAEAHWDLAEFLRAKTVEDSAYYHFAEAEKLFIHLNDDYNAGRMLYNMAIVQADVKDYTGSEITTIQAVELLTPFNQKQQLYNCYNQLGSVTTSLKEYDKAVEYFQKALDYLKPIGRYNSHALEAYNNLGVVFLEQGENKRALQYFTMVLDRDSLLQVNPKLFALAKSNLAYSRLRLDDKSELPQLFNTAVKIQDSIGDNFGISRSYYGLAEYYLCEKDTAKALANAQHAKLYAQRSSNNERLLETLKLFTSIDPKNATTYTREYIALNDSLQQEERKTRNKFARIRFETDEFIAQNQLLARQRQLWIGIAIGVFLLAGSIFIIISQRVKNQKLKFEQQQQESNQEIFDLMLAQKRKVEEVKQGEQKRISEELHDGVLGQMNGIRMVLLGLNKKTDDKAVSLRQEAITKLQDVQEEVRAISHELSYASYQKIHNFIDSIEELLKSIGDTAKLEYQFNYDQENDWDLLNGEIKINLYRIVQESLQNCVKHAKATKVTLDFDATEHILHVRLTDNGKGFDVKKGKRGIGLKNITSRVQKLNGTWDIRSAIGDGTTVSISIPNTDKQPTPPFNIEQTALQKA